MTKSDPNVHQNAPNCTILKKNLMRVCPRSPLAKPLALPCAACRFATSKFSNMTKIILVPPWQILVTPMPIHGRPEKFL